MGNDGLVISDSEPTTEIGKFTWLQVLGDGSRKWYERSDGGWGVVKTEDAPATADHTHEGLDNLPDIVSLIATGITGSRTVGGYTITFNHGILTGFEEV